ncbi:MAG: cytochrome C, partial [Marmoricola sp.]
MRLPRKLTHQVAAGLSTKRRSRFAGPALMLVALLLTGGIYAMFAPANADEQGSQADDVAAGR